MRASPGVPRVDRDATARPGLTSGEGAAPTVAMASKRTPARKAPRKPGPRKRAQATAAELMRRQLTIREIVGLTVAPGLGLEVDDAEAIARRVVKDHPLATVPELAPIVIAHVERHLAEVAA